MLKFDKENKITFEQLSFSLQNKLRKIVTRQEIENADNLLTAYEKALNNVRISHVSNLNEVPIPKNDADVAILNQSGAFVLYVFTDNRWVRIPTQDIFYTLTVIQSPEQTISIHYNGKTYTSTLNIKHADSWTATIAPDSNYYRAGTLNKTGGAMEADDSVYATPATLIKDFYLNMVIGKKIDAETYGLRIPWDPNTVMPEDQIYGSIEPKMFDAMYVSKSSSGTYSSFIAFFGDGPTDAMWDRVSIYLIYNGQTHTILSNEDLDNFNATGDISNPASFSTQYCFDLFKSLKGKTVQIHVHFDKD